MTKVVRALLLWMMLFALPIQGMAQASMFACHLNGDTPSAAKMTGHVDMNRSVAGHSDMDHSMHAMGSHEDGGYNDGESKKLMKSLHGCCNCAPTCAVVLLPLAQARFDNIEHETLTPASIPQVLHSADTRRIDRPPKTLAI